MKTSMLCLLPSKIAPRGRGVDDPLTSGDQIRRAIFIVVTLVGIVGATPSLAQLRAWQSTTVYGDPGFMVFVYRRGAEGGICGDTNQIPKPPACYFATGAPKTDLNQIFIDPFYVFTTRDPVAQTIRVEAYLYHYDVNASQWAFSPLGFNPYYEHETGLPIRPNTNVATNYGAWFGSILLSCPWQFGGCDPAFAGIPRGSSYTILLRIIWTNFYDPNNLLAEAYYIPGTNLYWDGKYPPGHWNSDDMGCAPFAQGGFYGERCIAGVFAAFGLPRFNGYDVGYLYFP